MTSERKIPELVAPAGSLAAFQAGLEAGADAFYLGVGRWNARARAHNFGLDEFEAVVAAAREKGRRIYLALNILVRDSEIQEILPILERAEACRVDAVILQDLGLLSLLRKEFPSLRLHASTQMFLHNSLHVHALARRGIRRVILPRELRLEEIQAIRSRCGVEVEVFVHGALCFSFSGMCLASSWLFGFEASGNRGACKQVCRFAFNGGRTPYPFSMKDLEGRTHLKGLLSAGVDALKIEGRLRNADYVGETVAYYRLCLDAWAAGKDLPAPPARWRFGRRTTPGFFAPLAYGQMIFSQTEDEPWTGEPVGTVRTVRKGKAKITFSRKVRAGDRLRILKENGVRVLEFTWVGPTRDEAEIEVEDRSSPRVNWKVYRLGTSRAPVARSLRRTPVRLKTLETELAVSSRNGLLDVEATCQGLGSFRKLYPLPHRSGMPPLSPERVSACFRRAGQSPFRVTTVRVSLEDPLAVSMADLNGIRRTFFLEFDQECDSRQRERNEERRQRIRRTLEILSDEKRRAEPLPTLRPIPLSDVAEARDDDRSADGRLWVEIPLFVSEDRLKDVFRELQGLVENQGVGFVCHSPGWIDWLKERVERNRIASGSYLYCLNRLAVRFLRDAGCGYVLVSPDFPEQDRRDLLRLGGTALPPEEPKRCFVTRLAVPDLRLWRDKCALQALRRAEYTEVVLAEPDAEPD